MAGEWNPRRFAEMAVVSRDTVQPADVAGMPYIGLEHIGEGTLQLNGLGVAEDTSSAKSRFAAGDILFGKLRPYFRKIVRASFDGICSTDIWVVRPHKGVDPGFLFYLMASDAFIEPVVRTSEGTKMPRAKWDYAANLEFPLPPLPEQRAIAHILGTLDDKIELNRRMNETLEAMARALFKSWFVDFDPVRAKAEGRDPGLPKPVADLFPARLVDSELGEIPEGWGVKKLGDLLDLAYGKALKADDRRDGDVPVYGSNGQVGWHDQRLVAGPGIVVGRKGNPGIATWVPTDFFSIDTTFFVVPKLDCLCLEFLFYALRNHDLASLGADSAVPGLNRNLAYMSDQLLPPAPLLEQFRRIASGLAHRVNCGNYESRTLANLRDTLLPKLISGELRVKDAERFIGKATG